MICVIIAAKKDNKQFWNSMIRLVRANFSAVYVYEKTLIAESRSINTELVITDAQSFKNIRSDDTIIIFNDDQDIDIDELSTRRTIAIVNSGNSQIKPFVASTRLPAITCGLSLKDTVTLSSIDVDSAVINIQRTVKCFDGSAIESQENPVEISEKVDEFALMAIASICILCGGSDKLATLKA